MYELRVKQHFDAAHWLREYPGKCSQLHGHRWVVEVILRAEELDDQGMVLDFSVIKTQLADLLPDHQCLNHQYYFNPTAENLARYIYDELKGLQGGLASVTIWENPDCACRYTESEG